MKNTQSSITAQGMAVFRAVESQKPASERICYDPLARKLVSPWLYGLELVFNNLAEWRSPGVAGFVAARCRYIDDYLEKCLQEGVAQVVILGAGLDSRAYRFAGLIANAKLFEVDQPATQAGKIDRLKRIFPELPRQVTYVPIDFNEKTLNLLADHGFSRSLQSLFIWEGVVAYLKPEAVDSTLAWVRSNSVSGSSIIFDYIYPSAFMGKHLRAEVRLSQLTHRISGEPLVFGIEKERIVDFLTRRGFTSVVNASAEDLRRLYFTGPNQGRAIADIYSIVHAAVP